MWDRETSSGVGQAEEPVCQERKGQAIVSLSVASDYVLQVVGGTRGWGSCLDFTAVPGTLLWDGTFGVHVCV